MNTWTTKDGKTLLLSEMTDSHLENAIRYLARRASHYQSREVSSLDIYAIDAPDGASECAYMAMEEVLNMEPDEYMQEHHEPFQRLMEEAKRRKLKIKNIHFT